MPWGPSGTLLRALPATLSSCEDATQTSVQQRFPIKTFNSDPGLSRLHGGRGHQGCWGWENLCGGRSGRKVDKAPAHLARLGGWAPWATELDHKMAGCRHLLPSRLHSRSALHPHPQVTQQVRAAPPTLQIHAAPLPCHSIHGSYRDSHLTPDGGRQPWESPHPGPHSSSPRAHKRVPAAPRTHVCPWSRLRTAREWEELGCSDPGHRAAGGGVIK